MNTRLASRTGVPRVHSICYNNPDTYPPIVNSTWVLAKAGFQVDIFCRENGEDWGVNWPQQAWVRRIDTRGGSTRREYAGFVGRVLRTAHPRPAALIGHDMHGLLPARLLATRYRRPLIYHCHDFRDKSVRLDLGGRVVRAFEERFARTADLVIVPDADRAALMRRALRLKRTPLVVANAPLSRPSGSGVALREALREQGKAFERIVYRQGRIGHGHALEVTLQSIPLWDNPLWGFVIIGPVEPAYHEELTALARGLGVEGQVAILPPVGYDRIGDFTPGADLGHALYEPIHVNNVHITTASNKIMEYLAAGLPLLVSDTPPMRALVEKYGCGVTADQRVPQSIASAVNALLGDTDRARRQGSAGAQAFDSVFRYDLQFAPVVRRLQAMTTG